MNFPIRIEITNEIEKVITLCPRITSETADDDDYCFEYCPLIGPCLEYWTGDDTYNKKEEKNNMSIYALIGLDGTRDYTIIEVFESKEEAEKELRIIKKRWLEYCDTERAEALRIQELKPGFNRYCPFDEE